eukprot:3338572-Prymnesium_polylepis.1
MQVRDVCMALIVRRHGAQRSPSVRHGSLAARTTRPMATTARGTTAEHTVLVRVTAHDLSIQTLLKSPRSYLCRHVPSAAVVLMSLSALGGARA